MTTKTNLKDCIHKIAVHFVRAVLPSAKKAFYLKAVRQKVLDIHGIALMATVYTVSASPKVIEDGLTAGMELMYYLIADGYKIKTPIFNLGIRIPGEYDGNETSLLDGVYPEVRLRASKELRDYIKERVELDFYGSIERDSLISVAIDEATGTKGELMTIGNLLTLRGIAIKVEADEEHKEKVGVYFVPKFGPTVKAQIIAVNTHKTLKVFVPAGLKKGMDYSIYVETQSPIKAGGVLLKKIREVDSKFTLVAA